LHRLETYADFAGQVRATKRKLLSFLIEAKSQGKALAGYGAPGKGNTLLNYCGIRTDYLDYTVDRNPYKQGKYLPGTHIPIFPPEKIAETKSDYVLILPWNLKDEIMAQLAYIRSWGRVRRADPGSLGHLAEQRCAVPRYSAGTARAAEAALLGRPCRRHRDRLRRNGSAPR
jgi:hypothetical protein